MPIPLSNEMREVRAPRTADLKAVNPGPAASQLAQASSSFAGALGNLGKAAIDAKQKYDLSEDAFKRNEAERIYNERTTELNTELAQKQGEERIKFQPKYEAEMKLASDTYEAAINKVGNFEIREGSKRSINAWNNRNASNYQYENDKNETKLQEQSMAQALLSDNQRRIASITSADNAQSLYSYATDTNLGFAHGEQLIRDFYKDRMGLPDDVVDQYVKDYKSKGAIAMAARLAQVTDDVSGLTAYNQSLDFINRGIKDGFINPSEGIEAKRTLELQKIDMVAELNPGSLINNDGTYNFKAARRYAPDLTQKELYQHISSSSKGRQGSGIGALQDQLNNLSKENWNDLTLKMGRADQFATDDFKKNRASDIAGTWANKRTEILDLIELANWGENNLYGVITVDEAGVYTDPKTGQQVQTTATGTKRIVDKAVYNELNSKVQMVKDRIATLINTGEYKDIFTPEVTKATPLLPAQTKATLANLELLYKKKGGQAVTGWKKVARNVLDWTNIKHFDTVGAVGTVEVMSAIKGTQSGIGEAQRKYGFDPESKDDKQWDMPVQLKQYNQEKGTYEVIPGLDAVSMETAVNMEIGYATLRQMDDGMFQSIYGQGARKPETVADMATYDYQLDFNGGNRRSVSRWLNSLVSYDAMRRIGNAFVPLYGSAVTGMAKALDIDEPAPFNFTDAQAYEQMVKFGNSLKKGLSHAAHFTDADVPEKDFQDLQFLNKLFSGKPNNEPLTYDEFIAQEGAATPESYADYRAGHGSYLRNLGLIQSVAFDKNNPAEYFLVNNDSAFAILDDMYAKASGIAPQNPAYISEDIEIGDVFAAGGIQSFNAPTEVFGVPTAGKESNIVSHNAPMFFLRKNGTGYVYRNGMIRTIDCNATEFVTLLGIAQGLVNEQPNVTTQRRGVIPSNMISNQFKPR